MSLDLVGVLGPLLFAGLMILASGRPKGLALEGLLIWAAASIAWAQLLPRVSAPAVVFPAAVWLTVILGLGWLGRPRMTILRIRWRWFLGFTTLIVGSAVAIGWLSTSALMQVLGWGHDNSAHIFLAEANAYCGGLLSACRRDLVAVPSYLIDYPQGFSVTWASLPGAFTSSGLLGSLHAYAAIYLLTSLALVVVTGWLAIVLVRRSRWAWGAGILAALTVAVGVWSHQFWSGFASFLWASLLIMAFIVLRESGLLAIGKLWIILAGSTLISVYYTHQLLFPFLLTYVTVDVLTHRRFVIAAARQSPLPIAVTSLVVFLLGILAPRSAQGNSFIDQVVVEAGMEAIPLWLWVPLAIVGGFVVFSRSEFDRPALRWSMITGGLMFGGLAILTVRENGYVSYYPMKLLTFLVLVLIAASASVVVGKPIDTRARQAWFTLSGLAVLGLAVLPPLLRYPGFKTAYQGSTPTVLRTLTTDLYGGGVALCSPFVLQVIDQLPADVGRVEVYRFGLLQPLEGRWINQVRGKWDSEAWSNEIDWRPMSEVPDNALPGAIISHDGAGNSPPGVLRLDLGELCSQEQLPSVLPVG